MLSYLLQDLLCVMAALCCGCPAAGVIGQDVVSLLSAALAQAGRPCRVAALLNDTVGVLAAHRCVVCHVQGVCVVQLTWVGCVLRCYSLSLRRLCRLSHPNRLNHPN